MVVIERIIGTDYCRVITKDGESFLDLSVQEDKREYERIINEADKDELQIGHISLMDSNYEDMKKRAEEFCNPGVAFSDGPIDETEEELENTPEEISEEDTEEISEELPEENFEDISEDDLEENIEEDHLDEEEEIFEDLDQPEEEDERERRRVERSVRRSIAKHSKGLKIIAGVALLASIVGIGYSCSRKQNKTKQQALANNESSRSIADTLQNVYTNQGMAEAINRAFANNETAKEFYTTLYETLNTLNLNASKDSFVNGADKDANVAMRFTYKEVLSAMLALNDYTEEDLYKIFGNTELNKEELVENYENFINKMIIYSMNAKEPSGVDRLIKDEGNKTLVKLFDSAIATFNKNVNHENADRIIRYFDYYVIQTSNKNVYDKDIASINSYTSDEFASYKASTSDRKTLDDKTSDFVRHLVINMVQGYMNANSQGEYKDYRIVSSEPSNFDNLFTSDRYAQVQKGTNMEDYYAKENDKDLSIVETAGCTTEKVITHLGNIVDSLNTIQKSQNDRLLALATELVDSKKSDLADLAIDGLTEEEKDQIASDKQGKDIIAKYFDIITVDNTAIDFMLGKGFEQFEQKTFKYGDVNEQTTYNDFAQLFNTRVRGYTKVSVDNKNVNGLDSTKEEAKTETRTETKEVSESELTPEEKASAEKQKDEIDKNEYQVSIGEKTFDQGEASRAAKAGWEDATNYAVNETGSYKHGEIINRINPDYPTVVPVDETLFDIATNTYAFNGVAITSSDSQIQARLASDITKYANSDYKDSYKEGWLQGIEQVLSSAVSQGALVRSEAEELYRQAQQAAEEKNSKSNNNSNDSSSSNVDEEIEVIDGYEVYDADAEKEDTKESASTQTSQKEEIVETVDELEVYDVDSDDIMNPIIADSIDGIEIYDVDVDGYNVEEYWEENSDEYYALTDNELANEIDSDKVLSKTMN